MGLNRNYLVKVEDAKLADLQKALEQANIKVKSIIEIFKEDAESVES